MPGFTAKEGGYHQDTVKTYKIQGRFVDVDLCWKGKSPANDPDKFYDFYDSTGKCLNEGTPWMDDGQGVPSAEEVEKWVITSKCWKQTS